MAKVYEPDEAEDKLESPFNANAELVETIPIFIVVANSFFYDSERGS